MRILYEAEDGKIFDNKEDCEKYERENFEFMNHFFDSYNMEGTVTLFDGAEERNIFPRSQILSLECYTNVDFVLVETEEGLKALHDLADYCGYCEYKKITGIGGWQWVLQKSTFEQIF